MIRTRPSRLTALLFVLVLLETTYRLFRTYNEKPALEAADSSGVFVKDQYNRWVRVF